MKTTYLVLVLMRLPGWIIGIDFCQETIAIISKLFYHQRYIYFSTYDVISTSLDNGTPGPSAFCRSVTLFFTLVVFVCFGGSANIFFSFATISSFTWEQLFLRIFSLVCYTKSSVTQTSRSHGLEI